MPPSRQRPRPLNGHWLVQLRIVRSIGERKGGIRLLCIDSGKNAEQSTIRTSCRVSNMYFHIMIVHSEVYYVLFPIIKGRQKNKSPRTTSSTIGEVMSRSRKRTIDEALLCLFVCPDVPNDHSKTYDSRDYFVLSVVQYTSIP